MSPQRFVPVLPEELIFDILSRLPAKSLLRFESASKSFHTLLSSPHFTKSHLNHSLQNPKHLLTSSEPFVSSEIFCIDIETSIIKTLALDPNFPPKTQIIGSCNGFLCLTDRQTLISLWNPSTREHLPVPPDPRSRSGRRHRTVLGFGYSAETDEYKVMKFVHLFLQLFEVKVFTIGSGSWRSVKPKRGEIFAFKYLNLNDMVVYLNGAIYWLDRGSNELTVGSFDIGKENCVKFSCPDGVSHEDVLTLSVLGGCLCLTRERDSHRYIEVWTMKDSLWTKIFKIEDLFSKLAIHWCRHIGPVAFRRSGELVLRSWVYDIVLHYPRRETYEHQVVHGTGVSYELFTYTESLISLASLMDHSRVEREKVPIHSLLSDVDQYTLKPISREEVFDHIRDIKDPESCCSLEEQNIVREDGVEVDNNCNLVRVMFAPTMPHCNFNTVAIIGLSLRVKLMRSLPSYYKVDITLVPGSHDREAAVNKGLNNEERVAIVLEKKEFMDVLEELLIPS